MRVFYVFCNSKIVRKTDYDIRQIEHVLRQIIVKVIIRTTLEVGGTCQSSAFAKKELSSMTVCQYKAELAKAFQTGDIGHNDTVPEPWDAERILFSLDLEGNARFVIFDIDQDSLKETPHLTFNILIVGEEEEPSSQKCIDLFLQRVGSADNRASSISIRSQGAFHLFPLNEKGEIDDEGHYYIAKLSSEKHFSWTLIAVCILFALLFIGAFIHIKNDLLLTLAGVPLGIIGTELFDFFKCRIFSSRRAFIDIDETLKKESENIRNQTDATRSIYSAPVEQLRHSKGDCNAE